LRRACPVIAEQIKLAIAPIYVVRFRRLRAGKDLEKDASRYWPEERTSTVASEAVVASLKVPT